MVQAGANGNLKHPKVDVQDVDVSFNISCDSSTDNGY